MATTALSPMYTPTFDYAPEQSAEALSSGVTFALLAPRYGGRTVWVRNEPFQNFSRSMGRDFEELLSARGFGVVGPYSSYDLMTYPQKRGSDLLLSPQIDIRIENTSLQVSETVLNLGGPDQERLEGTLLITGEVRLEAAETTTMERMWIKSVPLPTQNVAWHGETLITQQEGELLRADPGRLPVALSGDPGYMNPLSQALEAYYPTVLQTAWDYLDPDEMRGLKVLADSLKSGR